MFNGKFKLICSVIGLVAVLVMGLAMLGVTQTEPGSCPSGPVPCINRGQLVNGLQNAFAGLTANMEDLLDFERAVFWSDGTPRQIAYIPPDPASGLWDRVQRLRAGETVEVPFGGLFVSQGKSLLGQPPLALKMRLRLGDNKDHAEIVFINSAGEEVIAVPATLDLRDPSQECGESGTLRPKFSVEVLDYGGCPLARSWSNDTVLGGKACAKVKICCLGEGAVHVEWK